MIFNHFSDVIITTLEASYNPKKIDISFEERYFVGLCRRDRCAGCRDAFFGAMSILEEVGVGGSVGAVVRETLSVLKELERV